MRTRIARSLAAVLSSLVLMGCPDPVNPPTSPNSPTDTVINLAAIAGVSAPATGAAPARTIAESAQYTGTVSWSPAVSDFFVSTTTYTATIALTAKAGFTLNGVAADFFTVAGASSDTNPADSGVVQAVFPAAAANLAAVTDYTSTNVGTLKAVQGGTFNNGTADMTVSSFRMSQHEVTGEQYAAVMNAADPSYFSGVADNPVEQVSWYHSISFCNKLSLAEGFTPVYSVTAGGTPVNWSTLTHAGIPTVVNTDWNAAAADWSANGYRLPTEAEWQFAARGGASTSNYTYAGSSAIDGVAWYGGNAGNTTHAVGGKAANELGLHDMSGNVWEWCWDWNANYTYPDAAQTDYRGASSGPGRVMRGGSWFHLENSSTVASRSMGLPQNKDSFTGFRVVRP